MLKKGFYKVNQDLGGTYITATFYNPETDEEWTTCVRDYDYSDCSRDKEDLYQMEILKADNPIYRKWIHKHGGFLPGDTVFVFKGRKIPVGYSGKIVKIREIRDRYRRWVADYVVFEDGQQTNINNCILVMETETA